MLTRRGRTFAALVLGGVLGAAVALGGVGGTGLWYEYRLGIPPSCSVEELINRHG